MNWKSIIYIGAVCLGFQPKLVKSVAIPVATTACDSHDECLSTVTSSMCAACCDLDTSSEYKEVCCAQALITDNIPVVGCGCCKEPCGSTENKCYVMCSFLEEVDIILDETGLLSRLGNHGANKSLESGICQFPSK